MQKLLLVTIVSALMVGTAIYNMQPKKQVAVVPDHIMAAWNQWKSTHKSGDLYGSKAEESYRLLIFADNYNKVNVSNSNPKHTFKLELNKFADMSTEEFAKTYLGAKIEDIDIPENLQGELVDERNGNLTEATVDWVAAGRVTRIKDQGQCGSCWAFGTTGALEGLAAKNTGSLQEFSEQQLVDCWPGTFLLPCYGCGGGNSKNSLGYVSSHGIMAESDYPYTAVNGKCVYDSKKTVFQNKSYSSVTRLCNSCLRKAVDDQPVVVAIYAEPIQSYKSGVFNGSCNFTTDHAVLVVGYGTDNGQMYWKIKNSWGSDYGEDGYFRILRQDSIGLGQCWIAVAPAYPY